VARSPKLHFISGLYSIMATAKISRKVEPIQNRTVQDRNLSLSRSITLFINMIQSGVNYNPQ